MSPCHFCGPRCLRRSWQYSYTMEVPNILESARERAERAYEQRRYDVAAEHYQAFLRMSPDDADARVARVFALLNSNRPKDALAEAREAHDRRPNSDATAMALLEALYGNKLEGELVEVAEEISKKRPWIASAFFHRGNSVLAAKRYEEAKGLFDKAILRRPGYFLALLGKGDCLMKLGEHGSALYVYGRALNAAADSPDSQRAEFAAIRGRGYAYLHLGRPEKGLEVAREIEAMNVDASEAQTLKARCMFAGDSSGAVEAAENALGLGSEDVHLRLKLAGEYAVAGRSGEARKLLEGAEPEPDDYGSRHEKASVLMKMGDGEGAMEELRTLDGKLEAHVLCNSRAAAQLRADEPREAAKWLVRALKHKRDEVVLNNLGVMLAEVGKTSTAKGAFREALDLKPGFPEALLGLARCHVLDGETALARGRLKDLADSPNARELLKAAAVDLLARLERDQEMEAEHKRLGLINVPYGEREKERQLLVLFKSRRFEDECCRLAELKKGPMRWSSAEPRKRLRVGKREKEIDAYGPRRAGDREAACLGECKLRVEDPRPVDQDEINELVAKMELAREIEGEGGREIEGYFFANADYGAEARELAQEHGIRMFKARLTRDWQKKADWRVNDLEEVRA